MNETTGTEVTVTVDKGVRNRKKKKRKSAKKQHPKAKRKK